MSGTSLLSVLRSQSQNTLVSSVLDYRCSGCGSTLAIAPHDDGRKVMRCLNRSCTHARIAMEIPLRSLLTEIAFGCRVLLLHPIALDRLAESAGVDRPELLRWIKTSLTPDASMEADHLLRQFSPLLEIMIRFVFVGPVRLTIHFRRAAWLPTGWRGVAHRAVQQRKRGVDADSLELFQTRIIRAAKALGEANESTH